jgi:uncharacterized membrane protein YeaQ/YmgE (transglycosylase-associated protein family)
MSVTSLILFVVIGAAAGWLAGNILKGRGFGALGNILVGVLGAFLGGFLFDLLGVQAGGMIGSLVTATAGALILLWLVSVLKKL